MSKTKERFGTYRIGQRVLCWVWNAYLEDMEVEDGVITRFGKTVDGFQTARIQPDDDGPVWVRVSNLIRVV